ncbi:MAG: 4-hydroxybenzoate octaprenyltransferase [Planctomycetes bacterium]|nr:4-hydroxybenzoate octaprenyltransferase [Planctomycetota bacterium]
MLKRLAIILEMIKFAHTVFALPFAVLSAFLAADGWPGWGAALLILGAMVSARSCAMAFNRVVDAELDARNPRTASRALPAGLLTKPAVWAFTLAMAALFVLCAALLNWLAFVLSPVALAIVCGYSFSKRFTWLSHFWLGLSLAVAPVGAWIAVKAEFALTPLLLGLAVVLWVAGFDIIYACQDVEFDRQAGLHSLPRQFGVARALHVSSALHALTVLVLLLVGHWARLGGLYAGGVLAAAGVLAYEHWIVTPDDLSRVTTAFFTLNGLVSVGLAAVALADLLL